jgi:putative oxygen-independent coproporphyrinogen III oxidase
MYVHLPWCVRKCPYCDFNSHEMRGPAPFTAYVDALLDDLAEELPLAGGRAIETVFFGGGTPSLCPPSLLARFLAELAARVPLVAGAEITLEANPGAVERGRFSELASAGINRVSLGVQSFQPRLLVAIGRIHDGRDALSAIEELTASGITNYNLDLMYGLPGQTVEEAVLDLAAAVASKPTHLSHYQLTIEPGTPFYRHPPELPDEDLCWAMEQAAAEHLAMAGFRQYEVSGWARPGYECRHNLNYWSFGDYLGVGAGAHGKVTFANGRIVRRRKRQRPLGWLEGPRLEGEHALDMEERLFEFMLNTLRLSDGFSLAMFEERTGLPAEFAMHGLNRGLALGLLTPCSNDTWRSTPLGRRFLNDTQALFLPSCGSLSAKTYAHK